MTVPVEKILSDIIRIQSVNPPGGETAVAESLKQLCDGYGIKGEIIESAPGRGSFIATGGKGPKSLLFLSHTDVVPVGSGWAFDPFSGEIKDGFVHGRGAIDCKGLVAAEAVAFLNLVASGKLNGKLTFAAMADEEVGGEKGAGYLSTHCPEKLKADFAINEGAEPMVVNGQICHSLSIGEKAPSWLRLRTRGIAGHGSVPVLEYNAVVKMAKAIAGLAAYRPAIVLTPETKRLLRAVLELYNIKDDINEKNVDDLLLKIRQPDLALYLRAITRMTISPNMVNGGIKTNIVPDACEAQVDVRVLPHQNWDYVVKEIKPLIGDAEIEPIQVHSASFSGVDNGFYGLIESTLREFVGNGTILPSVCTGATDSRYLRELGVPAYGTGVVTLNISPALLGSVHGVNEKIDIASLRLKTQLLEKLAAKYLS